MKNMKYLNLFKLQYMVILILGCLFISSCTEEDMTVGTVDEKIYEFMRIIRYLTDDKGKQLSSDLSSDCPVICHCILI
ncbi:hypothetical protein KUBF_42870 [Bacteroides finegoldii]|nr:hypothetical protein KUBF_42870 [Bacteroides finegoldii]